MRWRSEWGDLVPARAPALFTALTGGYEGETVQPPPRMASINRKRQESVMNDLSIVDLGDAMVETKQLPAGEYRDNLAEPSEKQIGV